MTLRELIEKARADLDHFKHPDVSEVQDRIDELLKSGKRGDISRDQLVYLGFSGEELHIRTEYSVRGCHQSDDYSIPESVIDAHDPLKAMKLWSAQAALKDAEAEVVSLERQLNRAKTVLREAHTALQNELSA